MSGINNNRKTDSHDFWEVSQAAVYLTGQACTLSARHIKDGTLRIQFNREVAYYARAIVQDVEDGRKSAEEGLKALKDEQTSLLDQSLSVVKQSFGLAAGGLQVVGGIALCGETIGLGCGVGILMGAHGANNIYENGRNLWEGRSDNEGWVRKGYQSIAESKLVGGSKFGGDMAYGAVDLGLSAYGLFRAIPKKDSWRLFRYMDTDKEKALRQTAGSILFIESGSDISTMHNMWDEVKDANE